MKKNNSIMTVAGRILNRPLLIHADSLNTVLGILNGHIGTNIPVFGNQAALSMAPSERSNVVPQNGIAVIPVCGVLSYKQDEFMEWLFGETSYETISRQFQSALADPNITGIVFDIDSPGGEVSGCFDLVDEIYNARGSKPISAIINEMAYSAAYAIASATERIYLPRTASAGSVGVICVHMDQSKFDEGIGVKYTPIYAGARKNDYDPHSPLSDSALQSAQAFVNSTYELFVKTVARNRGLSPKAVRETEAALYYGKNAVDAGLADSVMSWSQALIDAAKKKPIKGGSMKTIADELRTIMEGKPAEEITAAMAELGYVPKAQAEGVISIAKANLEAMAEVMGITVGQLSTDLQNADFAAIKEGLKVDAAQIEKEVTARVTSILEICSLGGMEKMALDLVTSGVSVEEARTKVMEAKADKSKQTGIRSSVTSLGTGEVSPLVEDARRRAQAAGKGSVNK